MDFLLKECIEGNFRIQIKIFQILDIFQSKNQILKGMSKVQA
jgi:hypothetical protein